MSDDNVSSDRGAIRRRFDAAADTYDAAAVLQHEVGRRAVERFELIRLQPTTVLDLGAGTGVTTRELMRLYRRARFTAVDLSPRMLSRARAAAPWWRRLRAVSADATRLPFARDSFDVVFSNLMLQWVTDLDAAFAEIQRVLRPGGVLMFTTLGPDTLVELREAWREVDADAPHVNEFVDMHDIGDAIAGARLAEPVMDMERITLTYRRVPDLARDLRAIGAQHVRGGASGLVGPRRFRAMEAAYERHRDADGRLPATWEVVYGHAWGTDAQSREVAPGVTHVPVAGIGRRERGTPT